MLVLFSIFYAIMQSKLYRFLVVDRSRLRTYVPRYSRKTFFDGNHLEGTDNKWLGAVWVAPYIIQHVCFVLKALCLNSNFLRAFYVPT